MQEFCGDVTQTTRNGIKHAKSEQEEETGLLTTVFKNGELIKETSFLEIIEKITL